jgi:hypothetical protein
MRFTSDEAFEASNEGDPIMLNWASTKAILSSHSADIGEFWTDHGNENRDLSTFSIDAADVLGWLGY